MEQKGTLFVGALQCSGQINTLVQVYVPFKRLRKRKADCTAREKPGNYFPHGNGLLVGGPILGLRLVYRSHSIP